MKEKIIKYLKTDRVLAFIFIIGGIIITATLIFSSTGINFPLNKFEVEAQSLFYFPNFPTRLTYLVNQITEVNQELINLNEELLNFMNTADCKYAQSQCKQVVKEDGATTCEVGPIKVFGEFHPERRGVIDATEPVIEAKQSLINDLNIKLASLQVTLKGEIEIGLEKQLKTLRPEDAQLLKEDLEKINQLLPEMKNLSDRNHILPNECSVSRCIPNCELEKTFTAEACIGVSGQQKPIELKFKAGVGLNDMNLGRVGISNINLGLPDKINLPLPQLPSISLDIPNFTLSCPTQKQQITLNAYSSTLNIEAPNLNLSCPNYPSYSSYQCSSSDSGGQKETTELQWWNKTFEYLSSECAKVVQETANLGSEEGMAKYQELLTACFSPDKVVPTILEECDKSFSFFFFNKDLICSKIGYKDQGKKEKAIEWCETLFQEESEVPPPTCSSEPIETTGQKCDQIKNSGKKEPPLSCKLLPLFKENLEGPSNETIIGGGGECKSQNLGDFPNFSMSGCNLNLPSIPKISFPTIIVPDIYLPTFSLPPLFSVKLPNLIFEDLVIPDVNLCNLDDCSFRFPYLNFRPPFLQVPQITIPPVTIDIPGASQIDILIEPINLPPLTFNLPQLINLGNLVTPELNVPNISLPKPKIQFSFSGLNIDLLNLLLGLLKKPPSYNQCFSTKATLGVINISLPDIYFYWSKYPQIKEIRFCKDVRSWCQNANDSIKEITDKASEIEKEVNQIFDSEIQKKLDKIALKLNQKIKEELEKHLNKVKNEINKQLLEHLTKYAPQNVIPPQPPVPGVWQVVGELPCEGIPPLNVYLPSDLKNFSINPGTINEFLKEELGTTWPTEIPIKWPEKLKKFKLSCNESSCSSCDSRGDAACKSILGEGCPTLKNWEDYLECKIDYRINNCKNECKNCLSYDLPPVPLCDLSYEKERTERLPGHQLSVTASLNLLSGSKNVRACLSKEPSGGNPCQIEGSQIQINLGEMKKIKKEVEDAFQKIIDILY